MRHITRTHWLAVFLVLALHAWVDVLMGSSRFAA